MSFVTCNKNNVLMKVMRYSQLR